MGEGEEADTDGEEQEPGGEAERAIDAQVARRAAGEHR